MDYRRLGKELAAAKGETTGPLKMCLVTIIGLKLNDVVQDIDCPPFCVWSIDARNAVPTDEQKAACLKLWAENPGAPFAYEFPEDGMPSLPTRPEPTYTPDTESTEEDV